METILARLATLEGVSSDSKAAEARLAQEREDAVAEIEVSEGKLEELREVLGGLEKVLEERNAELEEVRKSAGKSNKVLEKAIKEVAACVSFCCSFFGHGGLDGTGADRFLWDVMTIERPNRETLVRAICGLPTLQA